ncbi:MAG: hypothetical protein WC682_03915 [Parcubacteria group bacterium]|jgi:DNA-binding transcriptional regulator PaaX
MNISKNIEEFRYSDSLPAVATKMILMAVAMGGIAVGGAIIPGIIKVLEDLEWGNSDNKDFSKKVRNSFHSLKRRKFIKIIRNKNGKLKLRLTKRGEKKVFEIYIDNLRINQPQKWDKNWRVLIFDIPIGLNSARTALRRKVKDLGFYQFQGSVWFYPYPCKDEILAIAEFFKVSEYVEIITANNVLHEKELKKHFKL